MSPMHTFYAQNELHLLWSTFPTIVPFPLDGLEKQTQQFFLGTIFLRDTCL